MTIIVFLNGSINSGKTTVGRHLASLFPDAQFIDGDNHGADANAPLAARMEAGYQYIAQTITSTRKPYLVAAYPLNDDGYQRLVNVCKNKGYHFFIITLAPPLDVVLADRGGRVLSDWEKRRIAEMYREGYAARPFSNMIVESVQDVETTAREICAAILRIK